MNTNWRIRNANAEFGKPSNSRSTAPLLHLWNSSEWKEPSSFLAALRGLQGTLGLLLLILFFFWLCTNKQPSLIRLPLRRERLSLPDINYKPWLRLWPLLNPINSPGCLNNINQKKKKKIKLWPWIVNCL